MAMPFRYRTQHHRRQQWSSRLCIRDAQSVAAAPLLGAPLRQRAGAQELRRSIGGAAAGANDRAVVVCGREAQIGVGLAGWVSEDFHQQPRLSWVNIEGNFFRFSKNSLNSAR